jgi:hypothetical protein
VYVHILKDLICNNRVVGSVITDSKKAVDYIISRIKIVLTQPEEQIFNEGDPFDAEASNFYFIAKGTLLVK